MTHWLKTGLGGVLLLVLAAVQVRGYFVGCYEGHRYLLNDYRMNLPEINSPSRCSYICKRLGHVYAGVQNGIQCLCGNRRPSLSSDSKRSEKDCQTPCPNSWEKCGGTTSVAVYSLDDPERPIPGYIGCYEDASKRLLPVFRANLMEINTPKKCIDLCKSLGFPYAGLEVGVECFCGNQKPGDDKKTKESECDFFCPFSSHSCGGRWRLSLYSYPMNETSQTEISDETVNKTHLGCFEDVPRILEGFRIDFQNINSPERCIHLCKRMGFSYAGVENGIECWCGHKRPEEAMKRNENDCATSCPHTEEKCGGVWRINVYSIE